MDQQVTQSECMSEQIVEALFVEWEKLLQKS